MYINPTLSLLLALIFVFTPAIQEWVISGGSSWYRPYLVWLGLIVFIALSSRERRRDEL